MPSAPRGLSLDTEKTSKAAAAIQQLQKAFTPLQELLLQQQPPRTTPPRKDPRKKKKAAPKPLPRGRGYGSYPAPLAGLGS
eukprot:9271251-Prorocentrum_lima.AAC.1